MQKIPYAAALCLLGVYVLPPARAVWCVVWRGKDRVGGWGKGLIIRLIRPWERN